MELKSLKYWKNQSPPLPNIPFTDPLFPPTINSLISKKLNGEYIDIKEGPIRSKKNRYNKYNMEEMFRYI